MADKSSALMQRLLSGSPRQRLLLIGNGLLIVIAIIMATLLGLLFVKDHQDQTVIPRATVSTLAGLRWNWFDSQPSQIVAVADADFGELADADIKAKLLGVTLSETVSVATISYNNRPEKVYRVGDKLGSSTVIKQIEPFRVVVEQNGARRQIPLEKADSIMQTEQASDLVESDATADEGFALAHMFGALPVQVDNYGSGFKLNTLSDEMKMLADIEDGDVVVDVGGMGVQDLMSDPAQWVSYSSETSLPVTVIRDGEELVIYVNAASLSAKMLPKLGLDK